MDADTEQGGLSLPRMGMALQQEGNDYACILSEGQEQQANQAFWARKEVDDLLKKHGVVLGEEQGLGLRICGEYG